MQLFLEMFANLVLQIVLRMVYKKSQSKITRVALFWNFTCLSSNVELTACRV